MPVPQEFKCSICKAPIYTGEVFDSRVLGLHFISKHKREFQAIKASLAAVSDRARSLASCESEAPAPSLAVKGGRLHRV